MAAPGYNMVELIAGVFSFFGGNRVSDSDTLNKEWNVVNLEPHLGSSTPQLLPVLALWIAHFILLNSEPYLHSIIDSVIEISHFGCPISRLSYVNHSRHNSAPILRLLQLLTLYSLFH